MLKQPIAIGVGTPNRVRKLLEEKALDLSQCRYVFIDSFKDVKNFSVLDWKETNADMNALVLEYLQSAANTGNMKFALV